MRKVIVLLIALFVLLISLAGCGQPKRYQATEVAMDTVVQLTIYDKNAQLAADKALVEMQRLDTLLNSYSDDSEIAKINKNAGQAVQVSQDTFAVVSRALEYARKTDGYFDPTIGAVSKLWGIGKKNEFVPDAEQIKQAVSLVDYRRVRLDPENRIVQLEPGMSLDLGGVAKSYILERMLQVLKDSGVKSALINGGGDVLTLGKRGDGQAWRIGVQDPRKSDGMLKVLDMDKYDQASTSGDYQRYFIKDGVRYHHIFDPRTGYPARGLIAATVLGRQAQMDIPSNVLIVMGEQRALEFIRGNYPDMRVILVDEQHRVIEQ